MIHQTEKNIEIAPLRVPVLPIIDAEKCSQCKARTDCTAITKPKNGREGWNPLGYPGQQPCPALLGGSGTQAPEEIDPYLRNYLEKEFERL
jgi:hypothetical protein